MKPVACKIRVAVGTLVTGAALLASSPVPSAAQDGAPLTIELAPSSRLWLVGSSTLHDFHSEAKQIDLTATRDSLQAGPADAAELEALVRGGGLKTLQVSIPVTTMRSEKEGLDHNLQKALKADKNPRIVFTLAHYEASAAVEGVDSVEVRAQGTLSVAGTERPVALQATERRTAEGIVIEGTQPLLMSDFGVKPPSMMLGTLRTNDKVTVHYKLVMREKASQDGITGETKEQP